MIPGMNPKQLQKMMKQMGMEQEKIPVDKVEFFMEGKKLIIEPCSVAIVKMMGQETFQVTGDMRSEPLVVDNTPSISDEDVKTVAEQANVSEEKARAALESCDGDLAAAIMKLSE